MDIDVVERAYKSFFTTYVPARTIVAVNDLPMSALVQVEALLTNGEGTIPNEPQAGDPGQVRQQHPQRPVRRDVHAVRGVLHYNNITAQLPIDPVSNQIVMGGVPTDRSVPEEHQGRLTAMDVPFDDIVKVTVFLKDLGDVEAMNDLQALLPGFWHRPRRQLPAEPHRGRGRRPAAACARADRGRVLGDGTATAGRRGPSWLIIVINNIADAPKDDCPPQTVAFSHYNNISAQLGVDPTTGVLVAGGVKAETEQALKEHQGHHRALRPCPGRLRQK